jgi:hypothetical protein
MHAELLSETLTPFGRLRRRWEDIIKMDLKETLYEGVYWVHLAQHRNQWQALMNKVMRIQVP